MNAYEKLIKTMRSEADRKNDPYPLKIATMTASDSCMLGSLELDSDDLLIASHLSLSEGDQVVISQISEELFVIIEKVVTA